MQGPSSQYVASCRSSACGSSGAETPEAAREFPGPVCRISTANVQAAVPSPDTACAHLPQAVFVASPDRQAEAMPATVLPEPDRSEGTSCMHLRHPMGLPVRFGPQMQASEALCTGRKCAGSDQAPDDCHTNAGGAGITRMDCEAFGQARMPIAEAHCQPDSLQNGFSRGSPCGGPWTEKPDATAQISQSAAPTRSNVACNKIPQTCFMGCFTGGLWIGAKWCPIS